MKTYKVYYSPEALEHIKHIVKWYASINKKLPKKFKLNL